MRLPPKGTTKKIYCNTCNAETNHELQSAHLRRFNQQWDGEMHLSGQESMYCLWICRGCESATFEEVYCEYDWPPEAEVSTFYPKRENAVRQILKDYQHLPPELWSIYREVIEGFNVGLQITCAMGLRALLEGICIDCRIPDSGETYGLSGKLRALKEKLEKQGDLPVGVSNALDYLKGIGDRAAHGLDSSTRSELEHAIEFVEHLIEFIYKTERQKTVTRLSDSSESLVLSALQRGTLF